MFEDATRDPADDSDDDDYAVAEPAPEPIEATPELEDDVVEWERNDPLDPSFVDTYLNTSEPGLAADLAAVVTLNEPVRQSARAYEAAFNARHDNEGLSLAIEQPRQLFPKGPVVAVTLRFPGTQQVIDSLEERWGSPLAQTRYGQPCAVWTSETGLMRAVLDRGADVWSLSLTHYQSFEELFIPRPDGSLGLEPTALVGKTIDELRAVHGDMLVSDPDGAPIYTLLVNPSALSQHSTMEIELSTYAGKVIEIAAKVDMSCDRRGPERARAFLVDRLGEVSGEARVGEGVELRFASRLDISAFIYRDRVVMVRRARQ